MTATIDDVVGWLLSAWSNDSGPWVTAVALILLGFAAAGQAMGMEAIIGALFGGMVIGSSRWMDPKRLRRCGPSWWRCSHRHSSPPPDCA